MKHTVSYNFYYNKLNCYWVCKASDSTQPSKDKIWYGVASKEGDGQIFAKTS